MNIYDIALGVLLPLFVWRVYSRIKAQMARQRSILSRHYTGLLLFGGALLVPVADLGDNPFGLAALAAGAIAGILLGRHGLARTRFEETQEGYFFTPPPRMGTLVAMVLVARVVYMAIEFRLNQGTSHPYPHFTDSPVTMLSLGLSAAYFATFSAGLMRWRQRKRKEIDAA
jgi:hypothetical protein